MSTDQNPFRRAGEPFTIAVAPGVQVAGKGGKPRYGKQPRVMLSGSTVDVSTSRRAKAWRGKTLSLGLLLDQLFAFAAKKGFKPDRPRK